MDNLWDHMNFYESSILLVLDTCEFIPFALTYKYRSADS